MPITLELRPLYPSNWRELANWIKFERAGGHCEWCGRPHGVRVLVVDLEEHDLLNDPQAYQRFLQLVALERKPGHYVEHL